MMFKNTLAAVAAAFALSSAALAADITVQDPYARVSSAAAKSGAAFMMIENTSDAADRLIDVRSPAAKLTQLHTHKEGDNGIMQMLHVEEGFTIPAGETHMLKRGGDHVMLMGLTGALAHGDEVELTLVFETAGEITVTVPVDLERKADHGGHSKSH